jgi:hypothetical protein
MGKLKPLKGRCGNNLCKTNCFDAGLCRKHHQERIKALKRKKVFA